MVPVLTLGFLLSVVGASVLPRSGFVQNAKAPYHVAITWNGELTCSGSIVSSNYVVTAGHCIASPKIKFQVHAGSNVWNQGSIHNVSKIIVHELFKYNNIGTPVNDLALLHVDPPFKFDETTHAAKLFDAGRKVKSGELAVVTSWDVFDTGVTSDSLNLKVVQTMDKKTCIATFPPGRNLSDEQICTANPVGVENMCYGDSGAPLMIDGQQAGIASWSGPGCDQYKYPGVYTEVAYHRSWIDKHINA